jgi:hypothetical protein
LILVVSGCSLPQATPIAQSSPTPSEEDLATQISSILTSIPSPTLGVTVTVAPSQPQITPTVLVLPSETPSVSASTPIPSPQTPAETPTNTPNALLTPTQASTATQVPASTLPTSDPKLQLGNPSWVDTMDNGNNWPLGEDQYTRLDIQNGSLVLTAMSDVDGWRMTWPKLEDFYLELTMKTGTCSGSDHAGMIVRVPSLDNPDRGYLFGITCDGRYSMRKWDSKNMTNLVRWTANAAIHSGSDQTNRLGLMAVGNKLAMYVNGIFLSEVQDDSFPEGGFGIFVGSDETQQFTIYVDEVAYWGQ